jgi:hypothetical protein
MGDERRARSEERRQVAMSKEQRAMTMCEDNDREGKSEELRVTAGGNELKTMSKEQGAMIEEQ